MTLREHLEALVLQILSRHYQELTSIRFDVSKPREKSFGDFATNVAMVAAKHLGIDPMEVGESIAADLDSSEIVQEAKVAKPGFINITVSPRAYIDKLGEIVSVEDDQSYGYRNLGNGKKIQVEFVSANPTGPLNIVNARAAALGDSLVKLLRRIGYDARSEFYVNDSGTQVELLGESLRARFCELLGKTFEIPEGGYPGTYLIEIARRVLELCNRAEDLDRRLNLKDASIDSLDDSGKETVDTCRAFIRAFREFVASLDQARRHRSVCIFVCELSKMQMKFDDINARLEALEALRGSEPARMDGIEEKPSAAEVFLGEAYADTRFDFSRFAVEEIVESQRRSLQLFGNRPEGGLSFDCWFRESSLKDDVEELANLLVSDGRFVSEKDGAIWLRGGKGDETEEWVIRRSSGQPTYFLSDIAYHVNKRRRGFERVIDIWGPDHHGHVKRMQTAMEIISKLLPELDLSADWLTILIAQQVNLMRNGKRIQMSKRAGEYVTLDGLVREVGADVARFFFLMRRCNSHLDFDLDLAKKVSDENPVYYIQYAHARICSIIEYARKHGYDEIPPPKSNLELLSAEEEVDLIKTIVDFEDLVIASALALEPHRFTAYLIDLAGKFHRFYHNHRVVTDDRERTTARLCLCLAVRTIIRSAFSIMGISAPESM